MAELKKLRTKRASVRKNVTICLKKIETCLENENTNFMELEESLEFIKQKQLELTEIDNSIENLIDDLKELELDIDTSQDYKDKIILWKVRAEMRIKQNQNKTNACERVVGNLNKSDVVDSVKLPKLSLPTFSGNIIDWISFKDLFRASIVNNNTLSNAQKLQYLKSSLKGEAHRIVQALPICDNNFEIAWNLLDERFSNKREQIFAHIRKFFNCPNIHAESASSILNLVDNINEFIRTLQALEQTIDNFSEVLLVYLILQKLDNSTKLWWERELKGSEIPKLNTLIEFLKNHARTLQNSGCNSVKAKPMQIQNKVRNFVLNSKNTACNLCKKPHALYNCDSFLKMTPLQRFDVVKKFRLCINCFSDSHQLAKCNSKYVCKVCKSKHNYLLHKNQEQTDVSIAGDTTTQNEGVNQATCVSEEFDGSTSQSMTSCFASKKKNVLLATAIIYVKNNEGRLIKGRAILDCGSQISAISSNYANMLGLKQKNVNISISSLAGKSINVKKETCAVISNLENTFSASVEFLVLSKVTDLMPASLIDISKFQFPNNVTLADPNFDKPSKVDFLIGAEVFFDILRSGSARITNSLSLKETVFGYIVCGTIKGDEDTKHCGLISKFDELEKSVKRFWELENVEDSPSLKDEEIECEKYFCETFRRDKNSGKYIVNLPIKENLELGESKTLAKKRLEGLWKRLEKNPEMRSLYTNFMDEYVRLGHMREIEFTNNLNYYIMPHHGVYKADSSTTKLRVVFDASAPTSNGISLNNGLLKGGVVQDDLFSILLRFRKYKIAFVADVQKMYRQIWVNPEQCNFQCILWKSEPKQEMKLFQLQTVTYGTACAPFLATRTLRQLSLDEGDKFPLASAAALSDFYVDDILTGADNIATALELQQQLIEMLRNGGMELHKWCANEKQILDRVPLNHKVYDFEDSEFSTVKTLGLRWEPREENFRFNVASGTDPPTKRSVLSEIARLFDPLGLLGPVITQAKQFMQKLWLLKIDWNQELPPNERKLWERFRKKLLELRNLRVPRYVLMEEVTVVELHGFADASKESYGAAVYLRCLNSKEEISVNLLCSKSRVSPLKEITIPRLELCGAVLLTKLVDKVKIALKLHIDQVFLYTDSKIVLAWITKPLTQLKLFVKNRVSVIQELTELNCWRHVSSKDNPGDVISRGLDADKIKDCKLWWFGPPFLHEKTNSEPCDMLSVENSELFRQELKEVPEKVSAFFQETEPLQIVNNCSSFTKLQRVIAWCLRFINNTRNSKIVGCLSSAELSNALTCIIKNIQATTFREEIQCLKKAKSLPNNSNLLSLCPFLDNQGVLRVGGRLKNSNLGHNQKHPILLPNCHNLTNIVINYFHVLYFHIGAEGTLSLLRNHFWILNGRNVIRKLLKMCIFCLKVSARASEQLMADLPSARITPSRVFNKVGVDFAGPFTIRTFAGRTKNVNKCYICIFICFAVKAVHFEIVHSLTSEAFIGALRRFIARRNRPSEIFSDNGTNFVGANNELRKILQELFRGKNKDKFEDYVAREGIKWSFNPPSAPHFGGLWEAGIKSLKYHLKRIIGNSILTHEEFLTLVTQIEAVLNSRPLCSLSSDPNDFSVLTPAHFLVGSSLVGLPDPDYVDIPMNRLRRWQLIQKFTQLFWKRWSNEYLNRLQQRPKWHKAQNQFKEGDIVLVKNTENSGYLNWHLAKILKTHPGKDNLIRVITIKDKNGVFQRPISKIAALPFVN